MLGRPTLWCGRAPGHRALSPSDGSPLSRDVRALAPLLDRPQPAGRGRGARDRATRPHGGLPDGRIPPLFRRPRSVTARTASFAGDGRARVNTPALAATLRSGGWLYWGATVWLTLELAVGGAIDLFRGREIVVVGTPVDQVVASLGYPVYILFYLVVWK